jgi:tRNA modification GTPase
MNGDIDYDTNAVIANSRQFAAVRAARECVERAVGAIDNGFTQDIAGMDLEQALSHIGELDSRSVGEDIVSDIFSRFCIGK